MPRKYTIRRGAVGHCPTPEIVTKYLQSKLDHPTTVALKDHMVRCADCRRTIKLRQSVFQPNG